MKTKLFKACMAAACLGLFYGCTPADEEMAEFKSIEQAQNAVMPAGCEVINFDAGTITRDENGFVTSVTSASGSEQIAVSAYARTGKDNYNTDLNVANIFNSSQPWSQLLADKQVVDILTPHQDFGGGGVGEGGDRGSTYDNESPLENMMIINRTSDSEQAYDHNDGGMITFDFSSMGTVNLTSITVLDMDGYEDLSKIMLYDADNSLIKTVQMKVTGSNGKQILDLNAEGVEKMVVYLGPGTTDALSGSGAIDDIIFCREVPEEPSGCTRTQGYWKTHGDPMNTKKYDATWNGFREMNFFQATGETYYSIMFVQPRGNAYYILAHQYVAATLNKEADASLEGDALKAYQAATQLLQQYTPKDLENKKNKAVRDSFIKAANTLDQYNNGLLGPEHCE